MNNERRQRINGIRNRLDKLMAEIDEIGYEEAEYRDNMPENTQSTERYSYADEVCEMLSSAYSSIEEAMDTLEEAAK